MPRSRLRPRVGGKLGDGADAFSRRKGLALPVLSLSATSPVSAGAQGAMRESAPRLPGPRRSAQTRPGRDVKGRRWRRDALSVCASWLRNLVAQTGTKCGCGDRVGGGAAAFVVVAARSPRDWEAASHPRGRRAGARSGPGLLSPTVPTSQLPSRLTDLHRVLALRCRHGDARPPRGHLERRSGHDSRCHRSGPPQGSGQMLPPLLAT